MTKKIQVDHLVSEIKKLDNKNFNLFMHKISFLTYGQKTENKTYDANNNELSAVFGLWKNRDVSLLNIRQKAWARA